MSLQQIIEEEMKKFNDEFSFPDGKIDCSILDVEAWIEDYTHRIIKAAFEAAAVEDKVKGCKCKAHCWHEMRSTTHYRHGYNAANKARATNEKEVLATLK